MKTISPHINTNHHNYYKNNDHIAGDMNRNASISQAEYQRDACEEELYRLRYGIEQLLANTEQGDSRNRYRPRNDFVQNSYRTEMNDLISMLDERSYEKYSTKSFQIGKIEVGLNDVLHVVVVGEERDMMIANNIHLTLKIHSFHDHLQYFHGL
jgi:hypothetical protein